MIEPVLEFLDRRSLVTRLENRLRSCAARLGFLGRRGLGKGLGRSADGEYGEEQECTTGFPKPERRSGSEAAGFGEREGRDASWGGACLVCLLGRKTGRQGESSRAFGSRLTHDRDRSPRLASRLFASLTLFVLAPRLQDTANLGEGTAWIQAKRKA